MIRSAHARRMVIGVFITLMLLCQTTAAALMCVVRALPTPAVTAKAPAPCHPQAQSADDEAPAHSGCQDRCPSRDAAFTSVKIDIPAADAVLLPRFVFAAANPVATIAAPYARIVSNAAPPPRLLAYCRLLI